MRPIINKFENPRRTILNEYRTSILKQFNSLGANDTFI